MSTTCSGFRLRHVVAPSLNRSPEVAHVTLCLQAALASPPRSPIHRKGTKAGLLRSARNDGIEEKCMSIRKMISLHPDVHGHVNQPLGDAVHHAMYCAKMCLSCADA